jgi:hypothetical protein
MFKLGIVEQSLVISLDWCFVWIRTLLRFSLNFIVRIVVGTEIGYYVRGDSAKAERGGSCSS